MRLNQLFPAELRALVVHAREFSPLIMSQPSASPVSAHCASASQQGCTDADIVQEQDVRPYFPQEGMGPTLLHPHTEQKAPRPSWLKPLIVLAACLFVLNIALIAVVMKQRSDSGSSSTSQSTSGASLSSNGPQQAQAADSGTSSSSSSAVQLTTVASDLSAATARINTLAIRMSNVENLEEGSSTLVEQVQLMQLSLKAYPSYAESSWTFSFTGPTVPSGQTHQVNTWITQIGRVVHMTFNGYQENIVNPSSGPVYFSVAASVLPVALRPAVPAYGYTSVLTGTSDFGWKSALYCVAPDGFFQVYGGNYGVAFTGTTQNGFMSFTVTYTL
jgi:hypothetical protein